MPVSLNQYRATVETFNNHTLVCTSKCNNLFWVKDSQDFCLADCSLHYNGKKSIFFTFFLTFLTSKYNACSGAKFVSAPSFIIVATWTYGLQHGYTYFDFTKWRRPAQSRIQRQIKLRIFNMSLEFKQHNGSWLCQNFAPWSLYRSSKTSCSMYFQTYLDSSTAYDDGNLEIAGYN